MDVMQGLHFFLFVLSFRRCFLTSIFNFLFHDIRFYFLSLRDEFFRTRTGGWLDVFALPEALDFLYDQVTITTSYLSAVITLLTCFDVLHTSASSDDLISVHKDI